MGTGWALCSALPRSARQCRKAPRRARSPALHCGRKRAAIRKRQPASTPDGGLRRGRVAAGRVRLPGRIFARPGAAPLRRLRRHLPLQGRLLGRQHTERLPCKGSWMRRKAQTEGCIAALWRKYPAGSGRTLPPCFAGGMRRPGECGDPEGYLQGQVRHPSVACGDTSPCRGGFRGGSTQKGFPFRGGFQAAVCSKPPPR